MRPDLWGMLRDARYALPRQIEKVTGGPGPEAVAQICRGLQSRGLRATVGHFPGSRDTAQTIAAANVAAVGHLRERAGEAYLSVKAPPLGFDRALIDAIVEAASSSGLAVLFDAHAPHQAEATHALFDASLAQFPGTGCVLPARWKRSMGDAARFRDTSARLRIVKGEWTDPDWGDCDIEANYLAMITRLAGRSAVVSVATHSPRLAERALSILLDAGTPCELEQLRGLPMRRTMAIARRLGVPVRVYVPFGLGWLPYAADKALARPYLPKWMIRDRLGLAD
ncbi:MAG TPA: proline dehydrogenase family protein [Novosphingobium sp.]